jgi:SAM-dependent methyltransferase
MSTDPAARREGLFLEIRRAELELAASYLPRTGRILELGGGNGLQAAILAERGYDVVSLEVEERPPLARQFHPVEIFDGASIPYPDASFDAVFSSNVLEHVVRLDDLLSDTRRVLRAGATAVHLMPTPTWRAWSSVTYALSTPSRVVARLRAGRESGGDGTSAGDADAAGAPTGKSVLRRIRDLVIAEPHGHPEDSAIGELITFGSAAWQRAFERNGFELLEARGNGLFYTGDLLAPRLSLERRRGLARVLGSSCRLYHVRPAAGTITP